MNTIRLITRDVAATTNYVRIHTHRSWASSGSYILGARVPQSVRGTLEPPHRAC